MGQKIKRKKGLFVLGCDHELLALKRQLVQDVLRTQWWKPHLGVHEF